MKFIIVFFCIFELILFSYQKIILSVHAGAGSYDREKIDIEKEKEIKRGILKALKSGYDILQNHKKLGINSNEISFEAVKRAVMELENFPEFNAGKGGKINQNFEVELDSSIMNGYNLQAGAVAGIKRIKNPITAAEAVMKKTNHILIAGDSADNFGFKQKLEIVDNSYFFTEKTIKEWIDHAIKKYANLCTEIRNNLDNDCIKLNSDLKQIDLNYKSDNFNDYSLFNSVAEIIKKLELNEDKIKIRGTVGAVALDDYMNLSAGTSTGGTTFKMAGRIGDSPIIGAGTYANSEVAISCTGTGEEFIKRSVAYDISARMKYLNKTLNDASNEALNEFIFDMGGFIAIDKYGNTETLFNTSGMARGTVNNQGDVYIEIFGGNSGFTDITQLNYNINDSI